jgi:hypothetical protein
MKILVGIDDSPYSQAALDYVKRMKWPEGTQIVLAAVAQPVTAYAMAEVGGASWVSEAFQDEIKRQEELAARQERELSDAGLKNGERRESRRGSRPVQRAGGQARGKGSEMTGDPFGPSVREAPTKRGEQQGADEVTPCKR